jgi:hypothetical protein
VTSAKRRMTVLAQQGTHEAGFLQAPEGPSIDDEQVVELAVSAWPETAMAGRDIECAYRGRDLYLLHAGRSPR